VLQALLRCREYLETVTPLPTTSDEMPLVCGRSVENPIGSTRQVRNIVQTCFDRAVEKLEKEKFTHQAAELKEATVH
jgi:hypothetical protein